MYKSAVLYLVIVSIAIANGDILGRLQNYTRIFGFSSNDVNNELWTGIIRDCSKKVTFSCIQKNAYTYLDRTFIDRDNITVFDGLSLTRNNLDYENCKKDDARNNVVEDANGSDESRRQKIDLDNVQLEDEEDEEDEYQTPLEEITHALKKKTMKFLATRDYEIQLPKMIGGGVSLKISPREIDANGALVRIDFDTRAIEEQQHGRFLLKKLKKKLTEKVIMAVILIVLLIKILKIKFMFVIPFLFGIGTAKKLFLKLLLFFVPAFAHVFKLCSSYYTSHATKYHHHHHKVKIAHHHHHIPVPVPVYSSKPPSSHSSPIYLDHPPPSSSSGIYLDHPPSSHSSGPPSGPVILDDDFQGYDYAHPHIQYRKDIEELKEWGIEPYDESYDQVAPQSGVIHPGSSPVPDIPPPKSGPKFPGPFGMPPQYALNSRPIGPPANFGPKFPPPSHPQNLAYSAYRPPPPLPPPPSNKQSPPLLPPPPSTGGSGFGPPKPPVTPATSQPNYGSYALQSQTPQKSGLSQQRHDQQQLSSDSIAGAPVAVPPTKRPYDDEFYGPIVERLDEIFGQLRFLEESCRERLVCSMYKNPSLYSPHSNLVSNELSRDPQELQQGNAASASSQRFNRYLTAARTGQDGGDCLRSYPCGINTE